MNPNAKRVCDGCNTNLRELKAERKKEEIEELRERGGISDPTYYLNKISDIVSKEGHIMFV